MGGFAIGARVALLWQHNANPSYKLASIPRYDDILRTLGGVCARCWPPVVGDWRVTGAFSKLRAIHWKWAWLAGGDWPSTGGVLNITAAALSAGFHWWRSGNITRTQNVSEYMLLLALCLGCALLGGFAIGARVALLWQHNANPSYKLAPIPRYDDIVRTAGWAGSAPAAGR